MVAPARGSRLVPEVVGPGVEGRGGDVVEGHQGVRRARSVAVGIDRDDRVGALLGERQHVVGDDADIVVQAPEVLVEAIEPQRVAN